MNLSSARRGLDRQIVQFPAVDQVVKEKQQVLDALARPTSVVTSQIFAAAKCNYVELHTECRNDSDTAS
jgi:hypothetical protein